MKPYPVEIEQVMQQFYTTLFEKDRRRYAAVEASKLGHGGVTYIFFRPRFFTGGSGGGGFV